MNKSKKITDLPTMSMWPEKSYSEDKASYNGSGWDAGGGMPLEPDEDIMDVGGIITNPNGQWTYSSNTSLPSPGPLIPTTPPNIVTFPGPTPLITKINRPPYTVQEDPNFKEGEVVEVDLAYWGIFEVVGEQNIVEAVVIGKQVINENLINYIVDFGRYVTRSYPYKCSIVPITAIVKPEPMPWGMEFWLL